jgi:hypothetical protein
VKRIVIALAVVFLLILSCLFLMRPPKTGPQFLPVQIQPAGPFATEQYDWGGKVPVRDGKLWLLTVTPKTNAAKSRVLIYLYDLDRRKVIGQLSNANPVFANQDQTKLLCESVGSPRANLKDRLNAFVGRLSAGRISLFPTNWTQSFWVLDVRDNSAVGIGELSQYPGSGSSWVPAPGFRFGFNRPSTSAWGREFFLCDLDQNTLQRINFTGDLRGWWDDHDIMAADAGGNFIAFDVIARKSVPLFTKADVSQFLKDQEITNYPADYATIFNWNGAGYDLYLTANRRNGLDTNATFLIQVQHDGPPFKLISRSFNFHWLGYLDASATHYLYSGEPGKPGNGGNGGVYLRDLSDNSEHVLVPPDNAGQYALARIYSNTVIYWRNRVLWRVDINTTNTSRLFPPLAN